MNDGLTYGNYGYGLRVQDTDICLGEPDVTKVYGVFESGGIADPLIPSVTVFNMNGPTGRVDDLIAGEEFIGKTTGAIGLYIERINSAKAAFVYLSDLRFELNEQVEFVDHHYFSLDDLRPYQESTVLMTEKDAVKCQALAGLDWWQIRQNVRTGGEVVEILLQAAKGGSVA